MLRSVFGLSVITRSLTTSLHRAHNLCYTTLVVPEDVDAVGKENVEMSPSGHAFLKPHVREVRARLSDDLG